MALRLLMPGEEGFEFDDRSAGVVWGGLNFGEVLNGSYRPSFF